ncbi:hypothetical protein H5404_18120 [Vibrio parahaemolyticus]|uniref:hypothetical protein n=1 Tax=Vibrio parahaemolyticus TaxID=670 RepID=UPI001625A921|nr:hypothetical protein [Vibrio parahaemolyticus]QNE57738.1 hypothetical protein H5404_18120 [Vibrio parahaemolyticus]HDY7454434.1 hypothetical protein [Vibrio vulnificus]
MTILERYDYLESQNPKITILIELLHSDKTLADYLLSLTTQNIEFMTIPNTDNGFACVHKSDVKKRKKQDYKLLDKNLILLFGLTRFLKEKEIIFAKHICDHIKVKTHREIGEHIINEFDRHYFIESMKNDGVEVIQL